MGSVAVGGRAFKSCPLVSAGGVSLRRMYACWLDDLADEISDPFIGVS